VGIIWKTNFKDCHHHSFEDRQHQIVAERIKEKLVARGHQVRLEEIVAGNDEEMDLAKIILTKNPESKGYEAMCSGLRSGLLAFRRS
jgi:hypothetical protein